MATVAGSKRLLDISGNNISTAVSLTASGTLLDTNGAAGASNQVLSSTGSGVDWVDASSVIGGPYLPLAGGTLTGNLTVNGNAIASGIGVGTSTIYSNSVNLNNSGTLRIGNAEFLAKAGNDLSIYQGKIRVQQGGNVGVGTTSPTANLHVQGSSATDVPIIRSGGFGNSGSKLELAETLTSGDMNYGFSFFNDGNSSNTLMIKAHNNSTTGITAMTIARGNALTTFGTVPVVGTRTAGDNTTRAASTAFVTSAITAAGESYIDAATFSTSNGIITGTGVGSAGFTVDIDGRYPIGNVALQPFYIDLQQNPVGTTYGDGVSAVPTYYFGQKGGDNDQMKFYAESASSNDITAVWEINDDIETGLTWLFRNKKTYSPYTAIDALKIDGDGDVTVGKDLTITGGDIILSGTGRIQGVDTVSASTDAANKAYVDNAIAGVPQGDITAVIAGSGLNGGGTSGSVTLNAVSLPSFDTRSTNPVPNTTSNGVRYDFKSNSTNGLSDGGTYNGQMTWRSYSNTTDLSGGMPINIAYTANGNLWTRIGASATTWGTWYKLWSSGNDGAGSGLDADLLDGQQGSYYLDYANFTGTPTIPSVGNGQIDGRTSGLGLSGSMDATANQSGNTTFTVTSNAVTAANANTIAYRTSSADIRARLFRSNYANQSTISGGMAFRVNNGTDDYIRFCSNAGAIRTFLGVPASGDLNNYLLNTTDTFTGALTIDGELEMANGPNGIIYTTDDILTLSSGGKTSGTNIAIDDGGSVIKLNSDTIALGEFKVSSLTDGTGNDVFRALVTSSNSSFWLGDIEGLGNGSYIVSDGTTIKLRNNGGINTLVTDNSNNVEIPNGNLIISNQIGVNTTNFNPQAGIIVNGNQTFGTPGGGANVNSRYLSIEGGADSAGEGSGRIFFTEHNSTTAAMDSYGMSLGYRGGPTSIVGASGETWSGLSQIGNGEWGMWGHNNSVNGALIMHGDRAATYVDFSGNNIQGITDAYIADQIIHTGDTNTYMQFHAADQWRVVTGGVERLEINNSAVTVNATKFIVNESVGIGTTSPGRPLHVIGQVAIANAVEATSTGALLVSCDSTSNKIYSRTVQNVSGAHPIDFMQNSSAVMRIASDGNVGIGTTAPGSDLEIFNTSGSTVISEARISSLVTSGYGGQSNLWLRTSNYGNAMIAFGNQNGASAVASSASGKITYNSYNRIFTVTADSNALLTLGGSTDRVGVNQTNPQYTLDVTGNGRFTSTVTATNFILSSDEKLKENVEKVCGNKVEAEWKTFELKTEKGQKRYGVIAQELEKTNPEFVREDSQGFKSVAYIDLLIAKIAELEARLEKLEK